MPKGCVVFDLDGTLADTSGDLIAAANATLEVMGHPPLLERGRDDAVAVTGGKAMLRLAHARMGINGAAADRAADVGYPILLERYAAALDVHSVLYPGAVEALDALAADGYTLAICTNKPEALAEALMVSLGVRDRFGALIGADTLPVRKPDPEPLREAVRRAGGELARSLLVGDTETDRSTAAAAGVPSVLVRFGPGGDEVAVLAPEATLKSYADLPSVVARLMGD